VTLTVPLGPLRDREAIHQPSLEPNARHMPPEEWDVARRGGQGDGAIDVNLSRSRPIVVRSQDRRDAEVRL